MASSTKVKLTGRKLWSRIEPVATHGTVNIGYKASLKLESTNEEGEPMFQIRAKQKFLAKDHE